MECIARLRGATVARLTPDQKAACSNHVGVNHVLANFDKVKGTSPRFNQGQVKASHQPSFLSVVVITSALHAEGRRFEPGRKHFTFKRVLVDLSRPIVCAVADKYQTDHPSFLSVVVITSALHA